MNCCRVRRPISAMAEIVIPFAANATNSVPHRKILYFGALLAALLVGAAAPMLFQVDIPVAAGSTLKCYDSGGHYEPCLVQASVPPPRSNGQMTAAHQPASWTITALYQPESWAALYQPESSAATEPEQPAGSTTSASAAQRIGTRGKHQASATCRQRLLPCFFSSLEKGLTHIALAAAAAARTRPAKEHL